MSRTAKKQPAQPAVSLVRQAPAWLGRLMDDGTGRSFAPAPAVREWIQAEILEPTGRLHNPDHMHLIDADFEVLWAAGGFSSKMRQVIGQCEELLFRASPWAKLRQEEQMAHWFGRVPKFLLTLDASYAAECSEGEWCALVEHELYHIGHKHEMGAPKFGLDGKPKLAIRGHDVEEFIGVVRRYGTGGPDSAVSQMVKAAQKAPEVAPLKLSQACGTCLLRSV